MQRKGADGLTATELNATVYRYLQESGFVHTAFNFFYEAGIEGGNIHGMIPQGALIRIMHKGLHCIELEANSEIGSDDEHHFFDTLDLITNDLDELRKKITDSLQWKSVKNDKEQNSVETDKAQCSAEATTTAEAMRKMKDAQNSNPEETATIGGTKPMRHAKAQGKGSKEQDTSSAETAQKTGSAETTTGQLWQLSWIGKKPRLRKPRPS